MGPYQLITVGILQLYLYCSITRTIYRLEAHLPGFEWPFPKSFRRLSRDCIICIYLRNMAPLIYIRRLFHLPTLDMALRVPMLYGIVRCISVHVAFPS